MSTFYFSVIISCRTSYLLTSVMLKTAVTASLSCVSVFLALLHCLCFVTSGLEIACLLWKVF